MLITSEHLTATCIEGTSKKLVAKPLSNKSSKQGKNWKQISKTKFPVSTSKELSLPQNIKTKQKQPQWWLKSPHSKIAVYVLFCYYKKKKNEKVTW